MMNGKPITILETLLGNRYYLCEIEINEQLDVLLSQEIDPAKAEKYRFLHKRIMLDALWAEKGFEMIMQDYNRLNRDNLAVMEAFSEQLNEQMPFVNRYLQFQDADEIDRVLLLGISYAFNYMYYYAIGKGRKDKDAFLHFARAKKNFDYYMNYEDGVEHEASIAAEMLFAAADKSGLLMDEAYFCKKIRYCLQYIDQDQKREAFARALSITGFFEAERIVLSSIKNPSRAAVDRMMILAEYLLNIKNE